MKKLRALIISIFLGIFLIACGSGEADQADKSSQAVEPAQANQFNSQSQPNTNSLDSGVYVASSMMEDGDMTIYSTISTDNGYVKVQDDHTGTIYHDGVEYSLTWDGTYFHFDEKFIPYMYVTEESDQPMLVIYFLEESMSVVYRPVEESVLDTL